MEPEEKKVILVTGASTGIGHATAIELSKRSYCVVATVIKLEEATESLVSSGCDIKTLDVTDDSNADQIVQHIREKYGRCDVLMNNAGVGMPGNIETASIEDGKSIFEVNVWGVMRMCKKVAPLMRETGGGLILTLSSALGLRAFPFTDMYCASKYALEGMLEAYRYGVFQSNIKVAVVNPGPVRTNLAITLSNKDIESVSKLELSSRNFIVNLLNAGQPAEECANSICDIIADMLDRDVTNGNLVKFWNATCDRSRCVLEGVKADPDGITDIYQDNVKLIKMFISQQDINSSND